MVSTFEGSCHDNFICSLRSDIIFGLMRQSIASATKQDANKVITVSPYREYGTKGAQQIIAEAIAADFTQRVRKESKLSDSTWFIDQPRVTGLLHSSAVVKGFDMWEKRYHETQLQSSDPGDLACLQCEDTFTHQSALVLHSVRNGVQFCQGECKGCEESNSPCDLSRSTGPCTPIAVLRAWHASFRAIAGNAPSASGGTARPQCTLTRCALGSAFDVNDSICHADVTRRSGTNVGW